MICILFPIVGIAAAFFGALIGASWFALSLMFGIPTATPDQYTGIVLLSVALSQFGVLGLIAYLYILEGA